METEMDGHLPFLDIDTFQKPDGSVGDKVYRKPTHMKLYLNSLTAFLLTDRPCCP
jgi:hypothetical protein